MGNSGSRAHGPAGEKAGSAIDRASLRRIERHGGLVAALGASHRYLDPLLDSGNLGGRDCGQPIILRVFAGLATFRFVLQTFVVKKTLLAGSPNEWLATIDAGNRSILKIGRLLSSDLLRPAV